MFSIISAAGWPIWFLILTSLVGVVLIVERFLALRRKRVMPDGLLDELVSLHAGQLVTPELRNRLAQSSPLGKVLAAGLVHQYQGRARMKEAMNDAGHAVAHDMDRFLSGIGTVATVAPLLGLFGTVIGMIEIFGAQAPTGINPQQLAYGISVALYNTAFGIIVAIPALICYRHFRARVDAYLAEMEQQAARLVDMLDDDDPLSTARGTGPGSRGAERAASPVRSSGAATAAPAATAAVPSAAPASGTTARVASRTLRRGSERGSVA